MVCLTTSSGAAVLVASDSFSYPDGPTVGATGSPWVRYAGTAGQSNLVNGKLIVTAAESEDIRTPLVGAPYTTGILTASFNLTMTTLPLGNGNYFAHFRQDDPNSIFSNARLWANTVGAASGSYRLGLSNSINSGVSDNNPMNLALNTTYLVTLSLDLDTDIASLSINGGAPVSATDAVFDFAITDFAFRQIGSIGTMNVDDLAVNYTAPASVPEPASCLLGAMGLLSLLHRRR